MRMCGGSKRLSLQQVGRVVTPTWPYLVGCGAAAGPVGPSASAALLLQLLHILDQAHGWFCGQRHLLPYRSPASPTLEVVKDRCGCLFILWVLVCPCGFQFVHVCPHFTSSFPSPYSLADPQQLPACYQMPRRRLAINFLTTSIVVEGLILMFLDPCHSQWFCLSRSRCRDKHTSFNESTDRISLFPMVPSLIPIALGT